MSTLFGGASATSTANNTLGDLSKDVQLSNPPEDSISDLAFSSQSAHLAVASWDKKVRIYEISASGGTEGKAMFECAAPVFSCHWSSVCVTQYLEGSRKLILETGRRKGSGSWSRQGCAGDRSCFRRNHSCADGRTRPAHPLCTILQSAKYRCRDVGHWLVG